MQREQLIAIARGDRPAELVLRGGLIVNVLAGEVHPADVAIAGGVIAGVGGGWDAETVIELDGAYLAPALIEGHLHVESTLLEPYELARVVSARGTGTMVTDPHEIANVHRVQGVRWMLEVARDAPAEILVMASSCVPASGLETSGAEIDAGQIAELLDLDGVIGLAELMDYPGAIAGSPAVLAKLDAAAGRPVDGHAPGVTGGDLAAYVAAGPGSEHEATTLAEAQEKLRQGMRVMLREGTPARDLEALLPLVTPANSRRLMLVNDDVSVTDLLERGHLDHHLRLAVSAGIDPVIAVQMVTVNVAEWFGLADRGAIAAGRRADLVVFEDLVDFRALQVLHRGHPVARDGESLISPRSATPPARSVRIDLDRIDLRRAVAAGSRARVIEVIPDAIVTGAGEDEALTSDGWLTGDPDRDLALLAVIERHGKGSGAGVGLVRGLGLSEGALASTVAHDHHNLIAAGCTLGEIETAARRLLELDGGLVAVRGSAVLAELALPIAGLMATGPAPDVSAAHSAVVAAARQLGSELADPFMTLSFLGLEVIPSLKLTDRGLVDVDAFRIVSPLARPGST